LVVLAAACARTAPVDRPQAWCNVESAARGHGLSLPPGDQVLAASGPTAAAPPGWVVVWASWCKPCEAEWPRIERALAALGQKGIAVRLTLLSIDTEADALAGYLRRHPGLRASGAAILRVRSADAFEAWARALGLSSAESGLPFHLLTASDGRVTCAHAGPLLDHDVAAMVERFGQ
jgi:thiol-disulfide isomerase/thioredoxin